MVGEENNVLVASSPSLSYFVVFLIFSKRYFLFHADFPGHRFCQSAIESAERDQELHVQSVVTSKQQQVEMFMSVFKSIQIERGEVASENLTYMEFETWHKRHGL